MKLVTIEKEEYDIINYFDIRGMAKGEALIYFVGTTDEAHSYYNEQQMRVVKEAVKNGIATTVQRVVKKIAIKCDVGVDKVNVFAYTVIRI